MWNKIEYQSNWNGGNWTLEGKPFSTKVGKKCAMIIDSEEELVATVVARQGVDYDRGHEYSRTNIDLIVTVKTPIGEAEASLLKFLSKNKGSVVYIKEIV